MEPVTKDELAKLVADLVYKDLGMLRQDVLTNRDHILLIDFKLSFQSENKTKIVEIIGNFLKLL